MKDEIIISKNPKSSISESFRTIRTNLMFTLSNKKSKLVLVASYNPSEGKTFISSNLAVAFSQVGKSTLIIDGDLRLGKLHKVFNINNDEGLSNLLVDDTKNYKKYIKKTNYSKLSIITRGTVPPNPSELLNSDIAKDFFSYVRSNYDQVILDGVPINGLTDSLIMAGLVDKTVLVVAEGSTKVDEVLAAKKALNQINVSIAGVVVNKSTQIKKDKYYYYR